MPENYRERTDLTRIIKSILDSYPLGNGILRELLQNSDDASATTQTFILDMRTHASETLVDPELAGCQGPALLAVNDTLFTEKDWEAIRTLHNSSKTGDETKIGKFGIGARACYHITDNPHFLSGRKLAIFDPHERFSGERVGGVRVDVVTEGNTYHDQLAAFDGSLSPSPDGSFPGTVVRLPLRTRQQAPKSEIKQGVAVNPSDIKTLFLDFVKKELSVVMLFLKHIRTIRLMLLTPDGLEHQVGDANIPDLSIAEKRAFFRNSDKARMESFTCAVNVKVPGELPVTQCWRICHSVRSKEDTSDIMTQHLNYNADSKLAGDKLFSHVALAFPIGASEPLNGRLFTLLPLPIHTGFPIHLHAILALTQDRQSLRNIEETGTGLESRERLLVTWNRTVFNDFLPTAWSRLLSILVDEKEIKDIWTAWPASSQANGYWQRILPNLLEVVLASDMPVFPTFPDAKPHVALSTALLASADHEIALLMALHRVGLLIVKPPKHILDALQIHFRSTPGAFVNPVGVREALLGRVSELSSASDEDKDIILQYLVLGSGTVSNVIGLPLVPLVNGSRVSLSKPSPSSPIFTLVTEEEEQVFEEYDDNLISLSKMPLVSATFCFPMTPLLVNVARLGQKQVLIYLHIGFGGFNPAYDEVSGIEASSKIEWLALFWKWMASWEDKSKILPLINEFHLLPSTQRTLRKIRSRIILPIGGPKGNITMAAWHRLGVCFLHPSIASYSSAFKALTVSPDDIVFLVDSISTDLISGLDLKSASLIQDHIVLSVKAHGAPKIDSQRRQEFIHKFKLLPIFPTRVAVNNPRGAKLSQRGVGTASGDLIYMRVGDYCPLPLTPDKSTFIDITPSSGILGTIIDPDRIKKALDELGVLEMAINHLSVQPLQILDALLTRIILRLSDLSQAAKIKLNLVPFVSVEGSSTRYPPTQVVDPRSELARVYQGEPGIILTGRWKEEPYLSLLTMHGYFLKELTPEIVKERVSYLSRSWSQDERQRIFSKAKIFLSLLDKDWRSVQQSTDISQFLAAKWLPIRGTSELAAPYECRPGDKAETIFLFDLVLSVVDGEIKDQNLRNALNWTDLPMRILQDQLRLSLSHRRDRATRLHALIKEFSRLSESLSAQDIETLRSIVSDHPWIPITQKDILETKHALLEPSNLGGSFKTVPRSLLEGEGRIFLGKMGCTESPCFETLLTELESIANTSDPRDRMVSRTIRILTEIAPINPGRSHHNYARILVPGDDDILHPIEQVYFEDIASDFSPEAEFPVNKQMSESLARSLEVQFLSSLELGTDDDDLDDLQMGEDFTKRVEGVLKEHDVNYALNEFMANAADAKATCFSVLLDERTFECSKVLSPGLADLQRRSSMFLYNDAVFRKDTNKDDFSGLRKVGQGGKSSDTETIGRYGLGALSLFHFTDVVQIISGEYFLILDPSGSHLPPLNGRPRTSLFRRLSDIYKRYPDQLSVFESIHGFSKADSYYNGTLFRLPLRNKSSPLSSTVVRLSDCLNLLNGPYFGLAKDALYFTSLETISGLQQPPTGPHIALWSIRASRTAKSDSNQIYRENLSLTICQYSKLEPYTQNWLVTKSSTPSSHVPAEYAPVLSGMKLNGPNILLVVQMAFLLKETTTPSESTTPLKQGPKYNLFSGLRLPVETSLTAHISAQFSISSDRRHIRFEPSDSSGRRLPQAAYNNWLLCHLIPPLYISSIPLAATALSRTGRVRDPFSWWPKDTSDEISRAVIQDFYQLLPSSTALACCTVSGTLIAPTDAVFYGYGTLPRAVEDVLLKLKPPTLVMLTHRIHMLAHPAPFLGVCKLRFIDPTFVGEIIGSRNTTLAALFKSRGIGVGTVDGVLLFLLKGQAPAISDLPLLVLADGTLASGNATYPIYACQGSVPPIFSGGNFLHQALDAETRELLVRRTDMNVRLFDEVAVLDLLKQRIPAQPRCIHPPATMAWLREFWETFSQLPGPPRLSSLDPLPLISTATHGEHISLEYCRRDDVISEPIGLPHLVAAMQRMDLVFCQIPEALRASFDKPFDLETCLRAIRFGGSAFHLLSENEIRVVGEWIQSSVQSCTADSQNIVQSLPIWEVRRNNRTVLLPATSVQMLPASFHCDTFADYIRPGIAVANYSTALRTVLSWPPIRQTSMNSVQLEKILSFPESLAPSKVNDYRALLNRFLSLGGSGQIPVPDSDLRLRPVNELFDDTEELFSAALQSSERTLFLHPQFRNMHSQLRTKDLRYQVDWSSFLLCARTVNDDLTIRQLPEAEIMERAQVVYKYYQSRVPSIVMRTDTKWRQLSTLRFIPRLGHRSTSSSYDDADSYCEGAPLPQIVSPSQLLRREYEQVAWTQRALFREEPGQILSALNSSLGVPSAQEVVQHLAVLALKVAPKHPRNRTLLQQLRATYQWLNQNHQTARQFLLEQGALFLNVVNPDTDPWEWRSAEELIFNIEYDYPETKHYKVRQFLQEYRPLLLAAGANSETDVDFEPAAQPQDASTLREAFNVMRNAGQLTDMCLAPASIGDPDEEIAPSSLEAHSAFLAAAIPHVRDGLALGWRESNSHEYPFPGTYFGACAVLDFIYTGKIERDPGETGEGHMDFLQNLLELLENADEWDMTELKDEIGRLIKEWKLLSRDTYWMIFDEAESYEATSLLKYCQDWAERNPESVPRRPCA
ncbi:hypothetical protein B0H10DRAFT_2028426 [Mycena sp. CBHHK59/15]|nr:hypothetical protein B0H10DRAFT_2028426 [Mycena sp. CBHHK59/15]